MEEAIATLDTRINEMVEALKKINDSLTILETRSANLTRQVQADTRKLQEGLSQVVQFSAEKGPRA